MLHPFRINTLGNRVCALSSMPFFLKKKVKRDDRLHHWLSFSLPVYPLCSACHISQPSQGSISMARTHMSRYYTYISTTPARCASCIHTRPVHKLRAVLSLVQQLGSAGSGCVHHLHACVPTAESMHAGC